MALEPDAVQAMTRPHLSRQERRLYAALLAADGVVVSHEQLVVAVYGPDALPSEQLGLKVLVLRMRRKGYSIGSLRGVGYSLGAVGRCPMCGREPAD